ncbi:MAG: LutB/LldF family L-lactate oxidation iron-sulfur protein [Burkholderiales bacterium]
MHVASMHFKSKSSIQLDNEHFQKNMRRFGRGFVDKRAAAVAQLDIFEDLRESGKTIRNRGLENLDAYLITFEQMAKARGAIVHWAEKAHDVNRIVIEIAQANGVTKIVKSKSMVSEESGLNHALKAVGIEAIETDLGEYIVQLAKEPPSHLIAPAIHKSKEDVAELFQQHHNLPYKLDIPALTQEARQILRPHFLSATMGISGGNFLIAETGSVALVTNEGNGRMVTTLPKIHVAITGIEKVLPTLDDFSTIMRLLPRSATGQSISNYVTLLTGPKGKDDTDGPEQFHVILVDSGRSAMLGTEMQEALRCIRCGACMNHCPVYQNIGGHSYGWVYPGPIGAVLTPNFVGLENALDLPQAATLCNACGIVCPVKIPLPDLMRHLREKQIVQKLRPLSERLSINVWRFLATHARLYAFATQVAARVGKRLGGADAVIHSLPGLDGWTKGRDMPAPAGKTFRELYAKKTRR